MNPYVVAVAMLLQTVSAMLLQLIRHYTMLTQSIYLSESRKNTSLCKALILCTSKITLHETLKQPE